MSSGIFTLPTPVNEPVRDYAPGSPERASLKKRLDELSGQRIEIPMIIGGREVRTGKTAESVMPHDHRHVLADFHVGGADEVAAAIDAAADGAGGVGRDAVGGPRRGVPPRRRPAGRALARDAQRRHHARPVEDRLPGGDRRGLRADRLLRFNAHFAQELYAEQPISSPRHVEQGRVPAARRASCSRSRRSTSPPSRGNLPTAPGADGQHGDLEARGDGRCYSAYFLASCSRRRGCRRASSTSCRARGGHDRRRRARRIPTSPASTSPARRPCSSSCGDRRREHRTATAAIRGSWARRAARTSSSRTPRPTRRRSRRRIVRGASNTRARSARPRAASTSPSRCGRRSATAAAAMAVDHQDRRRPRLPQLHGRGDRRQGIQTAAERTSTGARQRRCAGGRRRQDRRLAGLLRAADAGRRPPIPSFELMKRGDLRADRDRLRLPTTNGWTRCSTLVDADVAVRADRRRVRDTIARADRAGPRARCATPPATSTSTTSRPARSSGSSRSAARARRAPTTRPARS